MTEIDTSRLIGMLRKLAMLMASDKGYTGEDIKKAKSLATKLYVMHTNRKISLATEEFNLVLDVIQFDPNSVD